MSYPNSVQYLYALGNEIKAGAKLSLERMSTLMAELGHPEQGQRFIHVAGTNGKGSTCAMITSALRQAGSPIGLFTSPHLIDPTERIEIAGKSVTKEVFASLFETVHNAAERLIASQAIDAHPSYFETVTAMALLLFKQECSMSVIEVGLGGRLDATNIITPEICVITPVAYDHEAYLGNTLESIAAEKAGILKAGIPLVAASQHPRAQAVIEQRARQLKCAVTRADDVQITSITITATESRFTLDGHSYSCSLPGRHQIENAKTAILTCRALGLPAAIIAKGLRSVRWPGRLEFVAHRPDFILDGAHNPAGAAALASYIREFCAGRPIWLVYGAMRDKAVEEVAEHLFPLADRLIATAPNFPRALRPQAILDLGSHPNAVIAENVAAAIEIARDAPEDASVFFTGSLFLVGEARSLLAPY